MAEQHPSFSAVGAHLDEEIEKIVHPSQSQNQNKGSGKRSTSSETNRHGSRREDVDRRTEEMMRLGQ